MKVLKIASFLFSLLYLIYIYLTLIFLLVIIILILNIKGYKNEFLFIRKQLL